MTLEGYFVRYIIIVYSKNIVTSIPDQFVFDVSSLLDFVFASMAADESQDTIVHLYLARSCRMTSRGYFCESLQGHVMYDDF